MSVVGVCECFRMMCLESSPAVPNSISSSGRKHPDRISSRGESGEFGVVIRTCCIEGVFGVFAGGVGAVGGVAISDLTQCIHI